MHRNEIKQDVAQLDADWASGKYFQAGIDTAETLT